MTTLSRENQNVEWKESWRDEYLRWISGFANADGGILVIGRNDQGDVVGIDNASRLLEELPNKVRDLLGILVRVDLREEDGRSYLEIGVDASPNPISIRGEHYLRSGSTNQHLRGASLDAFLLRKHGRHWDAAPYPGVDVAVLDPGALKHFRKLAAQSLRLSEMELDEPSALLLERLHLMTGRYLTRAAVLLFHAEPGRYFSGCSVKIGFFEGKAELRFQDEVTGDVLRQPAKVMDVLRGKYLRALIHYQGIHRVERWPVPVPALREAVLNAIVHKDYSSGVPVQISVYEDKLMIWNPGQLPQGWTLEKLRGKHSSQPFNPDLATTFFRAGLIEAWGRGIERIFATCSEEGFPPPVIELEQTGLWLSFLFAPVPPRMAVPGTSGGGHETLAEAPGAQAETHEVVHADESRSASTTVLPTRPQLHRATGDLRGGVADLNGDLRAGAAYLRGDEVDLRGDLHGHAAGLRGDLRGDVADLRGDLHGHVAGLRGDEVDLRGDVANLDGDLRGDEVDLRGNPHGAAIATISEAVNHLLERVDGEMTRQELQDALSLGHREHFRKYYLQPALEANLIEMVLPSKPNSRNQRYRLTDAGRNLRRQGGGQ